MPFTQTDIDNLKAAIAAGKGAKSVTIADQSITFHSVAEMERLLALMQGDVTAQESESGSTTIMRYAFTRKGV